MSRDLVGAGENDVSLKGLAAEELGLPRDDVAHEIAASRIAFTGVVRDPRRRHAREAHARDIVEATGFVRDGERSDRRAA